MDITLLLQPHMWTDGYDFVIATTHVDRWTLLCYCNHRCGQLGMTLLLQPNMWTDGHDFVIVTKHVWTDGHDFVIATSRVDRWT